MSRISMEPHGRFGHLFAAAVEKKNLSLRDVAAKFDYSYEQMRKLVHGRSRPSKCLLTGLCDLLEMPYEEASRAANADRMEERYGIEEAHAALKQNPRIADIEPYLSQLDDREWQMFVTQIGGYVHARQRSQ
jgi:transcriptional regulator with XRE-family HTH domain